MALYSPHIVADMVDAQEYPELSNKYQVSGVPKSIINGTLNVTGAVPEQNLLKLVMQAANG